MDYKDLFNQMHPDFFSADYIREMPDDNVFAELILELKKEAVLPVKSSVPPQISFGIWQRSLEKLRAAVDSVDSEWVQYFTEEGRAFCAFDGENIAAFCLLEDWGYHQGLHIGGPGCVGTAPQYRRQGIGLEMVRKATQIFAQEEYDLSWIHYTHLEKWYSKLGYHTILRWGRNGFVEG